MTASPLVPLLHDETSTCHKTARAPRSRAVPEHTETIGCNRGRLDESMVGVAVRRTSQGIVMLTYKKTSARDGRKNAIAKRCPLREEACNAILHARFNGVILGGNSAAEWNEKSLCIPKTPGTYDGTCFQ